MSGAAVSGTGEEPDSEMLKFTVAAGEMSSPLIEEGNRLRLRASGWLEGIFNSMQHF